MAENEPSVVVETFVRASPAAAFDAFTLPERLTAFWLASASAPLAAGTRVTWEFLVPGAVDEVECLVFEPAHRLVIRFSDGTVTTWELEARELDGVEGTVLRITQTDLPGSTIEERVEFALLSTEGFSFVAADVKTLLERGEAAGIVRDKALLIAAGL